MKLSVLIVTYNHEAYIAQAIESALAQETTFDYEIVVGEDCSTDRTREIVEDFQSRFPDKIRALLRHTNVGMHSNLAETMATCRGQYVALLEGDDYWTDSHKLQKQVDFLDRHPECSISFHNALMIYEDNSRLAHNFCPEDQKAISTIEDLLVVDFIPTCSTVFRRGLFGTLPRWFSSLPMGDWPLHILNAQYGTVAYINEVMGVYRVHSQGAWSGRSQVKRLEGIVRMYEKVNRHLGLRYDKQLSYMLSRFYLELAVAHRDVGNLAAARESARRALRRGMLSGRRSAVYAVRFLIQSYIPWLKRLKPLLKKSCHSARVRWSR